MAPRYRAVAPIGRGGMAEVALALMDAGGGLAKVVVLKQIWPDLAADPDFVAMFQDEARLAIRFNHPNVVQTYEVLEDAQRLAIAMEYLHGQPLTAVLHRLSGPGELSLALRLRIVMGILAGLHHAHELTDYSGKPLGVVHRDVSPQNVFVTYDGQIKLMDFGVAKNAGGAHQTRPGALKGKLPYTAPEYIRRDGVDRRADVFAVGVMLWELLAGRRLWNGIAEAQIVHHLAAGIPLPDLPADAGRPPGLDRICARALAINPDERYATAAELEIDLEGLLVGAADSNARTLGRVVSYAFAAARAEREALIARALEAGASPLGLPSTPEIYTPLAEDELPDLTVVDAPVVPPAEAPAPSLQWPPSPTPVSPSSPSFWRRGRLGGTIAAGAISAAVGLGLVLAEARGRAPTPPAPMAQTHKTQAARAPARADVPPPRPEALTAQVAPSVPRETSPPGGGSTLEPAADQRRGESRLDRPARSERRAGHHDARGGRVAGGGFAPSPVDERGNERPGPAVRRPIDEGDPFR